MPTYLYYPSTGRGTRACAPESPNYFHHQLLASLLWPSDNSLPLLEGLTGPGLAPRRAILKNTVSTLTKWEVSDAWVQRFLRRHPDALTSQYTTGIDRNRHQADTEDNYQSYFNLLSSKIQEYNVDARHIYNMDEKGFLIGITSRSKRVFSKQLWEQKKVTEALQD
ncbi:hypothetical protein BDW02DRAFT_575424 [Decorospora gaudefroyi]|uniref:HTH CENPB-type domain-containing protein n=1 Tax=Decorospora gaudefroyi TaxID=184978 RepID=A0A6A5KLJ2_9PLEO|nr:hypothetical protein BDW02DRAFT_575424 [Decorospora gaudefroyi]